ncbi:transcription termination/antitermination protein NusG [Candidatus Venteria ishoeyi]|uniref:Transcription termination/antitermination protein NusG n=1 Tax=Candidatus Venteria ishoeyi TaxID=1899563 RepID=A0A1H6FE69_9GAMM|nr:transcription termination/antitermination protein NusG [Candidatus Venteria ishoeyi]MDM8547541.1 transcription termination/antitermination protein NusG [Candidatus Venteria ishoeyi]SEH08362.1 Uncharacterised protein [Candidatus Venteria ishoeyi]
MSEEQTLRWYVVHAYSGFEKSVERSLKDRIRRSQLEEAFGKDPESGEIHVLVPTEPVTEMREGRKRTTERKLYPGYVLVEMAMNDDTWHLVRDVPKVMGFIGGTKEKPAPISEQEANTILQRVHDSAEKPRPKILFEVGEVVRVIDGPFNDFNGVVEEVNYEKNRLRVAVLIFGRSTPVDLEFTQVEKE